MNATFLAVTKTAPLVAAVSLCCSAYAQAAGVSLSQPGPQGKTDISPQARRATRIFTVTAYCPCRICCGPGATGVTASGVAPSKGITCAASRSIPFGTVLSIQGVGTRIVQDRLAARYDSRIDVFFSTHADAKRFGIKTLTVKVNP